MTREKRLGRGLEALLGRKPGTQGIGAEELSQTAAPEAEPYGHSPAEAHVLPLAATQPPVDPPAEPTAGPTRLDLGQIDSNPAQPREDFDPAELESLAESLSAHGLLQPVVVRRVADRYQLIAGERRLRAAQQAGWGDVPANVIEADDRETAELAIVENMQRKDLNPLEKASSFQRYLRQYGCTQEELAGRLKIDRSTIANLIRLLELPEPVQSVIRSGRITQGHARALLPLGDEREQIDFCARIQRDALSVRQTESLVQETIEAADTGPLGVIDRGGKQRRPKNDHLTALEQELRAALGVKVKITHNARGRGKLTIHFRDHEEFQRLRRHLTDRGQPDVRAG